MTSATRAPGSTTVSPGTVSPMTDPSMRRKIIVASMVGTTIEFYDFYVYATAAVAVFPYLFFPDNDDPTVNFSHPLRRSGSLFSVGHWAPSSLGISATESAAKQR